MTHTRYWAVSVATAICGGFIAIERFAFSPGTATWIAFGVAIAATLFALVAFAAGLMREDHAFSGLSALNVIVGVWTIIAMPVFSEPTAVWLAFAGGLTLLLVSIRALALHETTVERVVYSLERGTPAASAAAGAEPKTATEAPAKGNGERSAAGRRIVIPGPMRSWARWLSHLALALGGAFVVLMTYALGAAGGAANPRWIAFGVGIAATVLALGLVFERRLDGGAETAGDRGLTGRRSALAAAGLELAAAVALVATMAILSGDTARWVAFGLGCALTATSLLGAVIHELQSERVRHELEVAEPRPEAHRPATPAT